MEISERTTKLWHRLATLFVGAACLFWLTIEDSNLTGVFMFAILFSGLIAIRLSFTQAWVNWKISHRVVILGGLAGILVPTIALILMAFKTGLHLHTIPEYTSSQISFIILSMPVCILGGAMAGLGWELTKR